MAQNFKQIPAIAFYTAIPQLLSRVIHDDQDTAMVVRGILRRVLVKFPQHAVWQLGWIRMSHVGDRREIGAGIFAEAEKALLDSAAKKGIKKENARRLTINHSLLVSSRSLFQHLQKLAKHIPQDGVEKITVTPWKGEVELSEFIPPVQAALSPSLAISNRGSEPFPRQIPRMTAFCRDVGVMHSRAKPKRLKAIAIGPTGGEGSACEIGEYHFLVKNEPKGDLRKDARVQDLNNVINRMMSVSSGQSLGHRRLHLRTFMVTVLSEDTGMLEWVPMTKTVRELVTKSYNPQASPFSPRRRGRRATHFVDNVLKGAFDKAHKMFLATADAKRAAAMFEELCLKAYPPLLYWWFLNHFVDPHSWYEARTRFALSCAVWSGVGHVIGLGDRHAENILVDTASGACVHVDFDW
jgi:serine/threonine-protein kinase ATR